MLIDIGVNLTDRRFDSDRDQVVARAIESGVEKMVCISSHLGECARGLLLADQFPGRVFTTAGLHPHHAKDFQAHMVSEARALLATPPVVAVGECGLDYDRDFSPRGDQRRCFEAQLALAAEVNMPVLLHQRSAHDDFLTMVTGAGLGAGAVVHCFTDSREALGSYLREGLYIGITGWICDERRGGPLREMVKDIPLDRILLETDAPYLVPRDLRPKPKRGRNEPSFLPHIARTVARYMNQDPAALAAASTSNAQRLFHLA